MAEKEGSIGNDAFCPLMNYGEEEKDGDVDIERCGVQWQRQW